MPGHHLRRRRRSRSWPTSRGFTDPTYVGDHEVEDLAPLVGPRRHQAHLPAGTGSPAPTWPRVLDHEVLDGVAVPYAGTGEWVELAARGVSKASGLALVCERLGIAAAEVVAVGDAWNDLPMLAWAGIGRRHGATPPPEVLEARRPGRAGRRRRRRRRPARRARRSTVTWLAQATTANRGDVRNLTATSRVRPLMPAVPQTLAERIEEAAGRPGAGTLTFVVGGAEDVVPWGRFLDEARAMAAVLQARGVGPGYPRRPARADDPAARRPPSRRSGCAAPRSIVLPLPMRLGSIEEFAAQTRVAHGRAPT